MRHRTAVIGLAFLFSFAWAASAQDAVVQRASLVGVSYAEYLPPAPSALPLITPEAALMLMEKRTVEQAEQLAGYQSETVIVADLPDTSQHGEFELVRKFTAEPRALTYSSVRYQGDGFVKNQVITKFLQSEIEHVKDDPRTSAITEANYKFSYKGTQTVNGYLVHVFQLKPRHKAQGLFKGKIYLDASSGMLRRMEGRVAKSPSFFIRSIDFVQDFDEIDGFVMPTRLQSTARARMVGRAIVNIVHRAYHVIPRHPASTEPDLTTAAGLR
jgi:hypothetical protein